MDTLSHLPDKVPWLELSIFVISIALVFTVFNYTVLNDSDERPATIEVPIPEQCDPKWRGEVLEKPSIKVFTPDDSMRLRKG